MLKLIGDTTDKRHYVCTVCDKQIHIDLNDHDQLRSVPNSPCPNCEKQKLADPVGKTYGQLTVKEKLANGQYLCQCTCGAMTSVYIMNLRTGRTKSCGCLKAQQDREARIDKKRTKLTNLQNQVDQLETSAIEKKTEEKQHLENWYTRKHNAIEEKYESDTQHLETWHKRKAEKVEDDYDKRMTWVQTLQEQIKALEKQIEQEYKH